MAFPFYSNPGFFLDYEAANTIWIGVSPSVFTDFTADSPALDDFKPTTIPETFPLMSFAGGQATRLNLGQTMHQAGGGSQILTVRGTVALTSQGAGESYAHFFLGSFSLSALGSLIINQREYKNCYFIGGGARIDRSGSGSIVDYTLQFIRSTPFDVFTTFNPFIAISPFEPIGRNNNGDYTAYGENPALYGGTSVIVDLGYHTDIVEISVSRPPNNVTVIPRAFGVRISNVYAKRGFLMRMVFRTEIRPDFIAGGKVTGGDTSVSRGSTEEKLHTIASIVGHDDTFTVLGNGNSFSEVRFVNFSSVESDSYRTIRATIEAVQQLSP
jgi:hypothetical protein